MFCDTALGEVYRFFVSKFKPAQQYVLPGTKIPLAQVQTLETIKNTPIILRKGQVCKGKAS